MCDYFQLGNKKLVLFCEALRDKFYKEAAKKSVKWENMFLALPTSFKALITSTR